jgi:hypothetical protein
MKPRLVGVAAQLCLARAVCGIGGSLAKISSPDAGEADVDLRLVRIRGS